jgi:hypothetical protein
MTHSVLRRHHDDVVVTLGRDELDSTLQMRDGTVNQR